jgi:hypothetical protein
MKPLLFTLGLVLSFNVFAQPEYVCKHGELIRNIDIVYSSSEKQVPCKVVYIKSTGTRSFWSTKTELGYCESKAEEFANMKRSKGWSCTGKSDRLLFDVVQSTPTEGNKSSFF